MADLAALRSARVPGPFRGDGLRVRRPARAVAQGAQPAVSPGQLAMAPNPLRNGVQAGGSFHRMPSDRRVPVPLGRFATS